uniref:Uncharacterized protein n=1 Tax=viral metagenome TaxID=1070528 RepID=A0A6M3IS13_9ZZZZ
MKKTALKIIGIVLVVVLILGNIGYWVIDQTNENRQAEEQLTGSQVANSFIQAYGEDARITQVVEPQKIFLVVGSDTREDGTYQHVSLYIDGITIKLQEVLVTEEQGGAK